MLGLRRKGEIRYTVLGWGGDLYIFAEVTLGVIGGSSCGGGVAPEECRHLSEYVAVVAELFRDSRVRVFKDGVRGVKYKRGFMLFSYFICLPERAGTRRDELLSRRVK